MGASLPPSRISENQDDRRFEVARDNRASSSQYVVVTDHKNNVMVSSLYVSYQTQIS